MIPVRQVPIDSLGVVLRVTMVDAITDAVVDVSATSAKKIHVKRSDGSEVERTAVFTTDGIDGDIEYSIVSGDLTVLGLYRYRGGVAWSATEDYKNPEWIEFEVVE